MLVNNAGFQWGRAEPKGIEGIDSARLHRTLTTNLEALFWITQEAAKHLKREQGDGDAERQAERQVGQPGVAAVAALLSLVWTPYDPLQTEVAARLQGTSAAHWMGTDQFGRDSCQSSRS